MALELFKKPSDSKKGDKIVEQLTNFHQNQQERKEQLTKIQEALREYVEGESELADLEKQVLGLIVKALEKQK